MPTINISPKVRFVLYLAAVLGGLFVQYAMDKSWFADAEFRLWSGIATLLMLLAAAKTNLSDTGASVTGTVVSETGETGHIKAEVGAYDPDDDESTHTVDEPLY